MIEQPGFTTRASGILAHISSLPSPFGIGDIGPSACEFCDFLAAGSQRYWQILPTVPTSLVFDSSPYMSSSAFAGSPLLISPQLLGSDGLLPAAALASIPDFSPYLVDYPRVAAYKQGLLAAAYTRFPKDDATFQDFVATQSWLRNYALFMTLKDLYNGEPWFRWPEPLARRDDRALAAIEKEHAVRASYYRFEQFVFHSQWRRLKAHAEQRDIGIIGDIPIYVGLDSADVWANQALFELDDQTLKPLRVSGVPPDYFSDTGQRWGNPLYRWNCRDGNIREGLLQWWVERFRTVFSLVDVVRIDHFRGFESYWAVPEEEETALNGRWVKGPGAAFFRRVQERLGRLAIIAEDLGDITPEVIALRDKLGFPGMKVLQFAFDHNRDNPFLPYNYRTPNCVVYTGTHDNDTTLGWFLSERLSEAQRTRVKRMANRHMHDHNPIHHDLMYLAYSSIAALAVVPLQDILGFGADCRMNTPGVSAGNWRWRCGPEFLTDSLAAWLKETTERFGR